MALTWTKTDSGYTSGPYELRRTPGKRWLVYRSDEPIGKQVSKLDDAKKIAEDDTALESNEPLQWKQTEAGMVPVIPPAAPTPDPEPHPDTETPLEPVEPITPPAPEPPPAANPTPDDGIDLSTRVDRYAPGPTMQRLLLYRDLGVRVPIRRSNYPAQRERRVA